MAIYYGANLVNPIGMSAVYFGANQVYSPGPESPCLYIQGTGYFKIIKQAPTVNLQYSMDNGRTWSDISFNTDYYVSGKCYFKGNNPNGWSGGYNYNFVQFKSSSDYRWIVGGNIMSLLDNGACTATVIPSSYCFYQLFRASKSSDPFFITDSSNLILPATTLTNYCYSSMFYEQEYMTTTIAELPATSAKNGCYANMFYGCKTLNSLIDIKCTTDIKTGTGASFERMFINCNALQQIKLRYTGNIYFTSWVQGVASSGTFYYNGTDTQRGVDRIPSGWTITSF